MLYSSLAMIAILVLLIWRWAKSVDNNPIVDPNNTQLLTQLQQKLPSFLTSSRKINTRNEM